jgi:hypothetical protein
MVKKDALLTKDFSWEQKNKFTKYGISLTVGAVNRGYSVFTLT